MISLVICTRNRLTSLRRCLDAVFSTNADTPFELIIVDNGSTDGTAAFLSSLPNEIGHITVRTTHEPQPGLARSRNRGVAASHGEIIAFTDDDCYVTPNWLAEMHRIFDEEPDVSIIGGRVLLYDATDFDIGTRTETTPRYLPPFSFVNGPDILGANMAFRRKLLDEIGGFDVRLGAGTPFGGCEETAAIAAALWRGHKAKYDPAPTVYHHHGRKAGRAIDALMAAYRAGQGAYYLQFLLNPSSRCVYARALCHRYFSELRVFFGGLRRGRWYPPQNLPAEAWAAVAFLAQRLNHTPR